MRTVEALTTTLFHGALLWILTERGNTAMFPNVTEPQNQEVSSVNVFSTKHLSHEVVCLKFNPVGRHEKSNIEVG